MPKRKLCNVDGCNAKQYALGVCKEHHQNNYVLGCTEEGCTEEVFSKERCRTHYMRMYRRKKGQAAPPGSVPIRSYRGRLFDVFTRISEEHAEVILRASGRKDGMYEKAGEILSHWAELELRKQARAAEHAA